MHLWKLILQEFHILRCWFIRNIVGDVFLPSPPRCPIGWQPHALAPVFYGMRDHGPADGAPGSSRVFFPSLDGSPQTADVLKGCGQYPLILFAHGHCELDMEHYKKWFVLPATLARAGYVVVVPEISHQAYPPNNQQGLQHMGNIVSWMRTCWRHRDVLLPPPATGVVGHSWGALLAARFAAENDVSAYASIGGGWAEFQNSLEPIESLEIPKFFCWGSEDAYAPIHGSRWDSLAGPKHKAVVEGAYHWDHLRPDRTACEEVRGPCSLTPSLTRDLTTMFFGRSLAREDSPTFNEIPANLIPPDLELTDQQQFFAGVYLQGFSLLASDSNCQVTLTWETDTESGTTTLSQ